MGILFHPNPKKTAFSRRQQNLEITRVEVIGIQLYFWSNTGSYTLLAVTPTEYMQFYKDECSYKKTRAWQSTGKGSKRVKLLTVCLFYTLTFDFQVVGRLAGDGSNSMV